MKKTLSYLGLIIASFFWGSTFFIMKDNIRTINPVTLIAYRFLLATSIFGVIVLLQRKSMFVGLKKGFLLGFVSWTTFITQVIGLQYTTASNSGFITGLFILFIPLFRLLFFRKHSSLMQLAALVIALIGLWFLTGGFSHINIGDMLTLLTAAGVGVYILLVDRYVKKIDPWILNFQQTVTICMLSFLTMIVFQLPFNIGPSAIIWSIGYLGIFATVIAFGMQFIAQKYVHPVTAGILMSTEPVFGALLAWTVGGEVFRMAGGIGGTLIFLAILVSESPIEKFFQRRSAVAKIGLRK